MIFVQLTFDVLVLAVLIMASVQDIKTRIVPVGYQYALGVLSVLHLIYLFFTKQNSDALWCLATGALVFGIYITIFLIFKTGIGGADTKVTSLMALYLGFSQTISFVLSHCIVALGYVAYKKMAKNEIVKSVPLMPFLVAGFIIAKAVWWIQYLG